MGAGPEIHVHVHYHGEDFMSALTDKIAEVKQVLVEEKTQRDNEYATLTARIAELEAKVANETFTPEDLAELDTIKAQVMALVPDQAPPEA